MNTKSKRTVATEPAQVLSAKPPAKSALVLKLLVRARGATVAELEELTGWQPHSVRAHLSGLRKQGRTIIRDQRKTGETVYRIVEAAVPPTAAAAASAEGADAQVDAEVDTTAATTPASV